MKYYKVYIVQGHLHAHCIIGVKYYKDLLKVRDLFDDLMVLDAHNRMHKLEYGRARFKLPTFVDYELFKLAAPSFYHFYLEKVFV